MPPKIWRQKQSFHPLKAGRRLVVCLSQHCCEFRFPSPQGGSETSFGEFPFGDGAVSIPSRRVGDRHNRRHARLAGRCFHPLKAGRRLSRRTRTRKHPTCFHPLKAGRRPHAGNRARQRAHPFPSPQGGSETSPVGTSSSRPSSSFHPLKAGRRRRFQRQRHRESTSFHPLKAGRRLV